MHCVGHDVGSTPRTLSVIGSAGAELGRRIRKQQGLSALDPVSLDPA